LVAQEERVARLEKIVGNSMPMLEEMQRNADEIKGHLASMQQILDEAMQAQAEPEVEVDLIYPEDEEATVELPKEEPAAESVAEPAPEPVAEPQPVVEEPTVPEPEPVAEPVAEPQPEPEPVVEQPVTEEPKVEETKAEAPRAPQQTTLFGTPVSDIRQAVSIGDRFLFQRELFAGNAEKLQQTLTELNNLHSLDEAVAFVEQFAWDKQSSTYELFLNVLRRRFQ